MTSYFDPKEQAVLQRVVNILRRVPQEELYRFGLRLLLLFPPEFKVIRDSSHLSRLIGAFFMLKEKAIRQSIKEIEGTHIHLKLLQTHLTFPFGKKPVLGITITSNRLDRRAILEESHIVSAVQTFLPHVRSVKGSFFQHNDPHTQIQLLYLEVECKQTLPTLSHKRLQEIQQLLQGELLQRIERLEPKVFMIRNEESIYRNILMLREEMRSTSSIAQQLVITFHEQTEKSLFFTVVLVRVIHKDILSVAELFKQAHPRICIIIDKVRPLGKIRRQEEGEAVVFQIVLKKDEFLRKDRSLNLPKARQTVTALLHQALGEFRDVDGGLIEKQNHKLQEFLHSLPEKRDEFLLENFFFSIYPISHQALLPVSLLREWFLLADQIKNEPLKKGFYKISCFVQGDDFLIMIKTDNGSIKEEAKQALLALVQPTCSCSPSEIAMDGTFLFGMCVQLRDSETKVALLKQIESTLENLNEKFSYNQHLRVCLRAHESTTLDPRVLTNDQSYNVARMLYEGLMSLNLQGIPEPAIACSFETFSDELKYRFYLRDSHWSNGDRVTAYDFEYSWKTALQPHTLPNFAHHLFIIKNAKKAYNNQISLNAVGIHALNEKTLDIELEYPCPYFLKLLCHWSFLLIHSQTDQHSPGWAYHSGHSFVCNGPFKLAAWQHHQIISLVKNPHYWNNSKVRMDRIDIILSEDIFAEMNLFQEKKVDFIGRPMSCLSRHALKYEEADAEIIYYPLQGTYCLWFNCRQAPFNHPKIRRAFQRAIDPGALIKLNLIEFLHPTDSPLINDRENSQAHYSNKEEAQKLFEEGLKELGYMATDLPSLSLSYTAEMDREPLMQYLKEQWEALFPVTVTTERQDWNIHYKRLSKGNYGIGAMELRYEWQDSLHILEQFIEDPHRQSITGWKNEAFTTFYHRLKNEKDVHLRQETIKQMENLLKEQLPIIPLYQLRGCFLKRKNIKNLHVLPFFDIDFKFTSIDRNMTKNT